MLAGPSMLIGGNSREAEIELAFSSATPADSANLRVGDLLILSQIRFNPPFGGVPTLIDGFQFMRSVGNQYLDTNTRVAGQISSITVREQDIGATFTQFRRMWCLRDRRGQPLKMDATVRTSSGTYDASALPRPIGFAYTVSRGGSTSPGTIGSISGLTVSSNEVESYVNNLAQCSIRLGQWRGAAPPAIYTMGMGTLVGDAAFRAFHAIYRAL
jgi:hypothetical protein